MRLKIFIYTAAKNEEKFVDTWANACGGSDGADGLYVLDTGSTDRTVAKLRERGVTVKEETFRPWKTLDEYRTIVAGGDQPWRFDAARNLNLDMLPDDADVCYQVDMDEQPVKGFRKIIEAHWRRGESTQLTYLHGWKMDGDRAIFPIHYNKVHARHTHTWQKPIHEILCINPGVRESVPHYNGLLTRHYPETKPERAQYLHMLELSCAEFPEDPVDRFYYCRELTWNNRPDDVIRVGQEFLALPRSTHGLQRSVACVYIADAYGAKKDLQRQEQWLLKACGEEPAQREGWYALAKFYRERGRNLDGYVAAKRALEVTQHSGTYLRSEEAWGAGPHDEAAITGWYSGFKSEAIAHGWEALRQNPHSEHLVNNYSLMLGPGVEALGVKATEPLDVIILSWAKDETQYQMGRRCVQALRQSGPGAVLNIVVVETNKKLHQEPWYQADGFGEGDVTTLLPDEPFGYNLYLQKAYSALRASKAKRLLILNNDVAAYSPHFLTELLAFGALFQSVSPLGLREALWGQIDQSATIHARYTLDCVNGWCILIDKRIFQAAPFEAYFPAELEFHNQDVYYAAMLEHYGYRHVLTTKAQALHLQSKSLNLVDDAEKKRLTTGQQAILDSLISKNIHKSKVYDCFTFFNELDTLELRLETLDPVVDKFVLVESDTTHSGQAKPYHYLKNCERFKRFWPKIVRVAVTDMPKYCQQQSVQDQKLVLSDNRWVRENYQRNAMLRGLADCRATDFVMISDVDEIPHPEPVSQRCFGGYRQNMYNYYYNVRNTVENWVGTVAATYADVLAKTPQRLRDQRGQLSLVDNGGWHFSWIGDPDAAVEKLRAFAHAEYDTPEIHSLLTQRMNSFVDFAGRSEQKFMPVPVDERFPRYLREHLDKFRIFDT